MEITQNEGETGAPTNENFEAPNSTPHNSGVEAGMEGLRLNSGSATPTALGTVVQQPAPANFMETLAALLQSNERMLRELQATREVQQRSRRHSHSDPDSDDDYLSKELRQTNLRQLSNKPLRLDGSNQENADELENYERRVETFIQDCKPKDQDGPKYIRLATKYLDGNALKHWQRVVRDGESFDNKAAFWASFRKAFGTRNAKNTALTKLGQIRFEFAISDYNAEFNAIIATLNETDDDERIAEDELVKFYLRGLVRDNNQRAFESVGSQVKTYLTHWSCNKKELSERITVSKIQTAALNFFITSGYSDAKRAGKGKSDSEPYGKDLRSNSMGKAKANVNAAAARRNDPIRKETRTCHKCQKVGHIARDCKSKDDGRSSSEQNF